jgi:predicted metal-dependent hydrolase
VNVPREIPGPVFEGIEEFNKGAFYGCHVPLKEAWLREPGRIRSLYQGILQIGVGFHHLQNGNWRGAVALLRSGIRRLEEFEPDALGIDVAGLVRESGACLKDLEDLGPGRMREFDRSKIPKVRLL